ncbi:MAG: HAMP domain-containing histidine kinase [Candidatus Aminicenantes bacterium]|nr:HAMP domain-containing histidine kinase [Candidatus Aminicenantes bacterium]
MKIIEYNPRHEPQSTSTAGSIQDEPGMNGLLREILPVVFHKLKNKLTPVLGYIQILKERCVDEFTRERLQRIGRNSGELAESLNLLKEYFPPRPPVLRPGELNAALEGMADRWQDLADRAETRVRLELGSGLPLVALDPPQLRLLLLLLADNAVLALKAKAGPAPEIVLTTQAGAPGAKLLVADNGRGMDDEERTLAFEPFFSRFPGHAGLGLALCEKILANHGAACAVFSQAGEYSRFEIDFPPANGRDVNTKKGGGLASRPQA